MPPSLLKAGGAPLIGAIPGTPNAFIATGHGCWGILNSAATARAMAELIVDGAASCVDLAPFDPAQLGGSSARETPARGSAGVGKLG